MEFGDFLFPVSNNWGYQNGPECQGYSDKAKMLSKLTISGDWI